MDLAWAIREMKQVNEEGGVFCMQEPGECSVATTAQRDQVIQRIVGYLACTMRHAIAPWRTLALAIDMVYAKFVFPMAQPTSVSIALHGQGTGALSRSSSGRLPVEPQAVATLIPSILHGFTTATAKASSSPSMVADPGVGVLPFSADRTKPSAAAAIQDLTAPDTQTFSEPLGCADAHAFGLPRITSGATVSPSRNLRVTISAHCHVSLLAPIIAQAQETNHRNLT